MLYIVDVIADNFNAPITCFIDETKVVDPLMAALKKAAELFVKYNKVSEPSFFLHGTLGILYSTWKNEHSPDYTTAIAEFQNPRAFNIKD